MPCYRYQNSYGLRRCPMWSLPNRGNGSLAGPCPRPRRHMHCQDLSWPRLCEKGRVSAPRPERRRHSHRRTQIFLESILRAPLTLPGAYVGADLNAEVLGLGCQGLQQPRHADDRHHALHVVGEHIERHLGCHFRQASHEKVCCTHPALDGAEGMLHCRTPRCHFFWMLIETRLHSLKHYLVFPTCDAPLGTGRTLCFQCAGLARTRPIAPHHFAIFFARKAIGQPLTSWTNINIVGRDIDKVLLAETARRLGTRSQRLRQRDSDAGLLAGADLLACVVAAISHSIERLNAHLGSRLLGHIRELMAVGTDVRHLVRDNEMVLGVDRSLHVVADDTGVLAARRHRARVRIGQRDLLVFALHHLGIDRIEPRNLFLQFRNLILEPRNLCLRHRIAMAVGSLQLRHVARDALVDPLKTTLHLGLGEVLVARVDSLEFGAVDRDTRHTQQIKLAAQRHKDTTDLTNSLAVVLAEVRNGLEVRRQLSRQPDQLDVALALTLKAAARWNAIEIAINVNLEQRRRIIAGPPFFQRNNPPEAKLAKIETINKSVNGANRIVSRHIVFKFGGEQTALVPINPLYEA